MGNWPVIIKFLLETAKKADVASRSVYRNTELNEYEYYTLLEIYRLGGECSYQSLISEIYCDKGTISKQLLKFTEKGFVECYPDPEDGNQKRVRMLEKALEYVKRSFEYFKEWEKYICEEFTEKEVKDFTYCLKIFYKNAKGDTIVESYLPEGWPLISHYFLCIYKRYKKISREYKKVDGLDSLHKYILLSLLYEKDDCSYKQLERMMLACQSDLVKHIDSLEERGYLTTYTSGRDKRIKYASITDKGTEFAVVVLKRFIQHEVVGCKDFSDEEKEHFFSMLQVCSIKADKYLKYKVT